jgi:hypothetical protein
MLRKRFRHPLMMFSRFELYLSLGLIGKPDQ